MTYQRLGNYIKEVNVRNWYEKVTNLQGVSISKMFILLLPTPLVLICQLTRLLSQGSLLMVQ